MEKLFYNLNGSTYYILFGKIGEKAFLCDINKEEYVIVAILEENSWCHGSYFFDFDKAYVYWRGQNG